MLIRIVRMVTNSRVSDFLRSAHANLQRNHVVCLTILFSCQGTDVRERGARLGAPHVRVKRNVFTFGERIPSDTVLLIRWKELPRDCLGDGPLILRVASRRVNCAGTFTT